MKQNIIKDKSFNFAVDIVNLYKKLTYNKKAYVIPECVDEDEFRMFKPKSTKMLKLLVSIVKSSKQ